jgi:RNA polymerase sigma-70 factor (ECF subfamily)
MFNLGEPPPSTRPASTQRELAIDDGKSAGRKSIAGSGHAVKFQAPGEHCQLTAVKIFGSRYGAPQPPAEDFVVYLCDGDGNPIHEFKFPYKNFLRGDAKWVMLKTEPIDVPREFFICVSFDPQATKGVYLHHDGHADGDSRTGLPGNLNTAFEKGDWMIRALITSSDDR